MKPEAKTFPWALAPTKSLWVAPLAVPNDQKTMKHRCVTLRIVVPEMGPF